MNVYELINTINLQKSEFMEVVVDGYREADIPDEVIQSEVLEWYIDHTLSVDPDNKYGKFGITVYQKPLLVITTKC